MAMTTTMAITTNNEAKHKLSSIEKNLNLNRDSSDKMTAMTTTTMATTTNNEAKYKSSMEKSLNLNRDSSDMSEHLTSKDLIYNY